MRYRLRTLLIVLALGPMVIAAVWWYVLPVNYVQDMLRLRQYHIDRWDREYPGWRDDPELIKDDY